MAQRKIPDDAFDYYFSLGPDRSYQAVADHYRVTKRAVTKAAAREDWQKRLRQVESKAREESDRKKAQALEAAYDRHMKALRLVFGKGVDALARMAIDSPADALRAIRMAIQEERVALGEPTDRTAISVEETIRREYERWMGSPGPETGLGADPGPEADDETKPADDVGEGT